MTSCDNRAGCEGEADSEGEAGNKGEAGCEGRQLVTAEPMEGERDYYDREARDRCMDR